jgi:predicted molibdopterin-dependent oxidoreductase YjgC
MPIRGHSGVQGGAEMGAYATALPGGSPVAPETAAALSTRYGFEVPAQPGLTTPAMLDRAGDDEIDVLLAVGGNFREVMPDPSASDAAFAHIPLRVHIDVVPSSQMLVDPADTVVLLPATTRYEIPGGVTETSTERRIIFSPEIPGPRVAEARPEWQVLAELAVRARPDRADAVRFADTAAIRQEIARIVPAYAGIEKLASKGDQLQYGGRHLCAGGDFPTPDGRARFHPVPVTPRTRPGDTFTVVTRRGKQFNSIVFEDKDSLNHLGRDVVMMAGEEASRLGLRDGDAVIVESDHGTLLGKLATCDMARGAIQIHWPEANVLLSSGARSASADIPAYKGAAARVRKASGEFAAGAGPGSLRP